ncbi:MAG: hypothetical protein AMJ70_02080 [Dehalococcoidia bacterium SG8_51_3]|nr:MAG: hypothetical protein AMJ70_02080 [Dehalococcoidia bacterium SG8_51_3]
MKVTWKPVVAGILSITLGTLNLFGMFVIIGLLVTFGGGILTIVRIAEFMPLWMSGMVQGFLIILAVLLAVSSSLPLIGGIYAIQRKSWGLALVGSIVAILPAVPLGIISTILIALSRDEFEKYERF